MVFNMMHFTESKITTKTFETIYLNKKFLVDIMTFSETHHEAWIYTDRMGIKELIFGDDVSSEKEFINLVKANFTRYAIDYIKEYY